MSASVAARVGQAKVSQKELNEKFEGLKIILKNIKSNKGNDLFTHLQEVFKILILHYPENALEKLEEVSFLLKHSDTFDITKFLKLQDIRNYKNVCEQMDDYIKYMKTQFGKKKGGEGEEEEEQAEPGPVCYVPDLLEEAKIWQWAGIGFGQQELYRLQKSLKKLAADSSAGSLRFFGVIKGTQKDYYVAEGILEGGEEEEGAEEKPPNFEARGTGVNKYTYWVTSSTIDPWIKLPDISPKDIKASRSIKVLFSGITDRQIFTNPYFFGLEKHYLRSQIARIYHSTTLCPKGINRLVEDSQREIEPNTPEEGEIVMPSTLDMQNPEMWVHEAVGILKVCRTTHMEPEIPEGEDVEMEELMRRVEKADPYDPRLKSITKDATVLVSKNQRIPAWVVRLQGDSTEYLTEQKKKISNGVVVVRSLQWPGSFNFYYQGKVMNIYVGNGHKYEEISYFPVNPPEVKNDPVEYDIQPEPTPLHEPVAVAEEKAQEEGDNEGDPDDEGQ